MLLIGLERVNRLNEEALVDFPTLLKAIQGAKNEMRTKENIRIQRPEKKHNNAIRTN
jgi:hypothetical protein